MPAPAGAVVGFGAATAVVSSVIGMIPSQVSERGSKGRKVARDVVTLAQAGAGIGLLALHRTPNMVAAGVGLLASVPVTRFLAGQRFMLPAEGTGPAAPSKQTAAVVAETQAAIDETRAMFTALGFGDADGNAPGGLEIRFQNGWQNAAYSPGRGPGGADLITIGTNAQGVPYSRAKDIVAHEYSHRIVDRFTADRRGEGGAIVESLADTFAAGVDRDDWTIGEDVEPGGLRNMRTGNGRASWWNRLADGGAMHRRLGLPDRAAAVIGDALGRDTMLELYADVLRHMPDHSSFASFKALVIERAQARWGAASSEVGIVRAAWAKAEAA